MASCIDCGKQVDDGVARCTECAAKFLAEMIKKAQKDTPNPN